MTAVRNVADATDATVTAVAPPSLQTIIARAKSGKGLFYSFISMASGVRFVDSNGDPVRHATFDVEHLTPPEHDELARTILRQCLDQSYTNEPNTPTTQYSPGFTRPVIDMDIKAYYADADQQPPEPRWARAIDDKMLTYCRLLQLSMASDVV
jgi:hypothetical protein